MVEQEICHVCGKEKKPYIIFMDSNVLSFIEYQQAREKGPICERCDHYFAMTGEFKDATYEEMQIAEEAMKFARKMFLWWTRDEPLRDDDSSYQAWPGTLGAAKWFRENYLK